MAAERELGNEATSVEALKIGYDVESYDPKTKHMRFIEVKGRIKGRYGNDHCQEVITSMHEPDKFILAIVQVESGVAGESRYVRGGPDSREPPFDQNAIQFNMKRLLEKSRNSEIKVYMTKKKLIEVAIPLEAINAASAREKIDSPRSSVDPSFVVGSPSASSL